jgi:hypothetical protein
MPSPNVFISSTFYDLRYIRENLMFFVRSLGYNPILSERGTIFFDPEQSAAEAAIAEVLNCQMLVLIIGGRFGTELGDTDRSVTNAEYQHAIKMQIPVFALVEQGAFSDYEVWRANSDVALLENVTFPNVDDLRVFQFIDEVRSQLVNNALKPFADFADIENYLRSQWASLLHSFLAGRNEEKQVAQALDGLERVSQRVEMLSTQILESVGTAESKLMAELYDLMLGSEAVKTLTATRLRPTPVDILKHESFFECAEALGGKWYVGFEEPDDHDEDTTTTTVSGKEGHMAEWHRHRVEDSYADLRSALQEKLTGSGLSLDDLESVVNAGIDPEAPDAGPDQPTGG